MYPASYDTPSGNVLSVAASIANDELADFSNWGVRTVHLGELRPTFPFPFPHVCLI